jgi:hypothetical protein
VALVCLLVAFIIHARTQGDTLREGPELIVVSCAIIYMLPEGGPGIEITSGE